MNKPFEAHCYGHPMGLARAGVRHVEGATDLDFPPVVFPSGRVLASCGEERLRRLVRRHCALLSISPVGGLLPSDAWRVAEVAERIGNYVVEACGGTARYSPLHGSTCMRTRHFAFSIDEFTREIWLAALFQAMRDVGFPADVSEEFWDWLEAFSVRMVNRRTMKAQPARIPYSTAGQRFDFSLGCADNGG